MPGIVSVKKTLVTIVITRQMNVLSAWTAFLLFLFWKSDIVISFHKQFRN